MTTIPDDFIGIPDGYSEELASAEIKERFKKLLGPFAEASCPLNIQIKDLSTADYRKKFAMFDIQFQDDMEKLYNNLIV